MNTTTPTSMAEDSRIPVIILTGFLGAGKTTLLNRLLDRLGRDETALIINEFGETGIDGELIEHADDTMIEISDGCICCTVRGEVNEALTRLADTGRKHLVIETTGLAEPLPLLQSVVADPVLASIYRIQAVLTVVDAINGEHTLHKHDEAAAQLAFADLVYCSKTDLVHDEIDIERLLKAIRKRSPQATIFAPASVGQLMENLASRIPVHVMDDAEKVRHNHDHDHTSAYDTMVLLHDKPVARQQIEMFCELVASAYGDKVLRLKGFAWTADNDGEAVLVQLVANRFEITAAPASFAKRPTVDKVQLVAITKGMNQQLLRQLFAGFTGTPLVDTPDSQALTDNPLSISGNWR